MTVRKISIEHIAPITLLGQNDANVRHIERVLPVRITLRDGTVTVSGDDAPVAAASEALRQLVRLAERGKVVEEADVATALNGSGHEGAARLADGERLGLVTKPSGPASNKATRLTMSPLSVPGETVCGPRDDPRPGRGRDTRRFLVVRPRYRHRSRTAATLPSLPAVRQGQVLFQQSHGQRICGQPLPLGGMLQSLLQFRSQG